ncbi:MAG: metalloregulator ArsR/SmtB family transcription factor [Eubacteriales bacterium]|nr:metalloregulator ArsR/SmtB family transcription factor [Eubacteriales bacterium]
MELSTVFKALGDPTRLSLFQRLLERKHCVRSLSRKFSISESAVSQHMKVLREAGLVRGERYGYHIHYIPVRDAVGELCRSIENMRILAVEVRERPGSCRCEFRKEDGDGHTC